MVVTRSGADAAEQEDRRREVELEEGRTSEIERERIRRLSLNPPASPTTNATCIGSARPAEFTRPRTPSPNPSVRSHRSTMSVSARRRAAEIEYEEKMTVIKLRQLQLEEEMIKKRHASAIAAIEEEESVVEAAPDRQKVNQWLQEHPPEEGRAEEDRRWRSTRRERTPTPTRTRGDRVVEVMEKLSRPRVKCADLPPFNGATNEWLIFRAAYVDSTRLYDISPTENLQRLRSALQGEARELVATLLYSATDPEVIIATLERSFGRPEVIIDRAYEEIQRLPRLGTTAIELNHLSIKVQNVVYVLRSLGREEHLYNPHLKKEILGKLSQHQKVRWFDYAMSSKEDTEPELVRMSNFLSKEAEMAMRYDYVAPSGGVTRRDNRHVADAANANGGAAAITNRRRKNVVYNVDEQRNMCPCCENEHNLSDCPSYKELSVDKRWELVQRKGMCYKCVNKRHRRVNCKERLCGVKQCRRPHHSSLHSEATPKASAESSGTVLSVGTTNAAGPRSVLLKMCPVTIVGPRGERDTYALLDEGATITLIDEDLAASVGAEGPVRSLCMSGISTTQTQTDSKVVSCKLRSQGGALLNVKARTLKDMKLLRQTVSSTLLEYEHLRDLPREAVCYEGVQPGILVGADHWEYIVSRELRVGKRNQPAASRTKLGWVIHGTAPRCVRRGSDSVLHVYAPEHGGEVVSTERDQRLHDLVEQHFRIDALGIAHKVRVSEADQRAIKIVEQTIRKTESGYEVGLPWKQDDVKLPPSYNAALRRLRKIEVKMDADPEFAREYTEQVENLLRKGYAAPCDGDEKTSAVSWYLPHFSVRNPNKPGKPGRLVFDAAAKSYGVRLNDVLLEGPDLLQPLPEILFRFRERKIAVTADIQEMFLRIKIRREDQPAQQFLWRGADRDNPPREYKMTSMIFGAASSPFLAHSVRDHNARAHAETHPRALAAITRSHYMDDFVDSFSDEEEARHTIHELREVHAAAGFTLRSWSSNDKEVLNDVPLELRATEPARLGGGSIDNKILGLCWDPSGDELSFNTTMHRVPDDVRMQRRTPTKREALSAVMSIYDPLGLLSVYTIRAKIILQSLWRLHTSWDEPIPAEEGTRFNEWLGQLYEVSTLRLRRSYALESYEDIELHVMCDASEQAYATVAYWRATNRAGEIVVNLVAAKAKVAPRRAQTIPRLELQAAVIGARLAHTVRGGHRVNVKRTIYWSDSSTVVHWIKNDGKRYTPFVAHRLGEIAELTQREEWRWIPTSENAADEATRYSSEAIQNEDRWFRGPHFLRLPEEQWPRWGPVEEEEEEEEVLLHITEKKEADSEWLPDVTRFSKYETLVRAAARVLAFTDMCRRRATSVELQHIERAERAILQRAQEDSFNTELQLMKNDRPVPKSSRLYKLDPVLEDGLLRVRGRIGASSAPVDTKRPVILDGRHPTTRLIVLREHCAAGHANRERVTNDLRQRYWVIHLRPTVRAVAQRCALCTVRRARPRTPVTGDLPRARLEPYQRPFSNCGLDYFGPMWVKIGRRREKRWGALFTCLCTRAVHFEMAASLSTDSAIMVLRRMAARRGWPRLMYSDNATAFKGADKELQRAYAEWTPALRDLGLQHRMEWRYIPPGAPNQGGAWERLVRSVKTALAATARERTPTEEVLHTLLTEAEFTINARPLTYVSVSADDPEALTPNHFLLGSSTGLPTGAAADIADRRAWRASQALADLFWRRWVQEYLPTLVPRGEPAGTQRRLQQGDVVVVVDHTLPRNVWPMGIVEATYPGPDGAVRIADVRTKAGVFRRPVRKLAVLIEEEATRELRRGEEC